MNKFLYLLKSKTHRAMTSINPKQNKDTVKHIIAKLLKSSGKEHTDDRKEHIIKAHR